MYSASDSEKLCFLFKTEGEQKAFPSFLYETLILF